jgi:hypothetical protein
MKDSLQLIDCGHHTKQTFSPRWKQVRPQVGTTELWATDRERTSNSMGGRIWAVDLEIGRAGISACFLWKTEWRRECWTEMKEPVGEYSCLFSSHFLFLLCQLLLFWRWQICNIFHKLLCVSSSAERFLRTFYIFLAFGSLIGQVGLLQLIHSPTKQLTHQVTFSRLQSQRSNFIRTYDHHWILSWARSNKFTSNLRFRCVSISFFQLRLGFHVNSVVLRLTHCSFMWMSYFPSMQYTWPNLSLSSFPYETP